jgi:alkylhydroperoxidase family enzyme
MSEPRIPLLSLDEARQAASSMEIPEALAELNIFRILLRQPKLAKCVSDLLLTLLFGGELDARLRELIIMRIGWATGSVYEWTQHWRIALQLGVAEADLLAVRDWRAHSHWSETDRAILMATDETLDHGAVSAETWSECAKHLPSDAEQLELLGAIGAWKMISQILKSLNVPLEDGVEPWPPNGAKPGF